MYAAACSVFSRRRSPAGAFESLYISYTHCSWSDSELITESQLQSLDYETARIVLNEIYARRGRQFKDEGLSSYFASKSWYNGTIKPENFSDEMLNEFEKSNIQIIQEYMDKNKQ